jgi:cleavage and polyadenylation specificity factor subunit 4
MGHCEQGSSCSKKHTVLIRDVVCTYYLIGECSKVRYIQGNACPYLHEMIPEKIPVCRNYLQGECKNPNCKFKHEGERREARECVFYNMGTLHSGFCPQGKFCKFKHARRELCHDYIIGKCSADQKCRKYHLNGIEENYLSDAYYKQYPETEVPYEDIYTLCFRCMQFGHPPSKCPDPQDLHNKGEVRCYTCYQYGHKSNKVISTQCPSLSHGRIL